MKSGCRSCALAAASSSALGINRRKITHTSTSRWAMPVRSSAPTALRYSASIRAWAHTKLIRQIVLTVIRTELNCSNAASFVMPAAANQRQAPSSRSFGAVHDGLVDRIVPETTEADRAAVSTALGMTDAWPVITEPFTQWIVEDRFAGGRPDFAAAGVQLVTDVTPFEHMKLRLLNAIPRSPISAISQATRPS